MPILVPNPPASATQTILPIHEQAFWKTETSPSPKAGEGHRYTSWRYGEAGAFSAPAPNQLKITSKYNASANCWDSGFVRSNLRFPARLPTPYHFRMEFRYKATHASGHWGCAWGMGSDVWLPDLVTGRRVWPRGGEPDFIETPYKEVNGVPAALTILHMGTVGSPTVDNPWSLGATQVPELGTDRWTDVAVQIDGTDWTVSINGVPVGRWSPNSMPANAVWPWDDIDDTWGFVLCMQTGAIDPKTGQPGWCGLPNPAILSEAFVMIADVKTTFWVTP